MRIVTRKRNNGRAQKFRRMFKPTKNDSNSSSNLDENFNTNANSNQSANISSSKRQGIPNFATTTTTDSLGDLEQPPKWISVQDLYKFYIMSEPTDQEILQNFDNNIESNENSSKLKPEPEHGEKLKSWRKRKIDFETVNNPVKNLQFLNFQDLNYNLWMLKILTVLQIIPTDLDVSLGLFKTEKCKSKGRKYMDQFLFGLWQIYTMSRFCHLVWITIPILSQLDASMKSNCSSSLDLVRVMCIPPLTGAITGVYCCYLKKMTSHFATIILLANSLIQNLERPQKLTESDSLQGSTLFEFRIQIRIRIEKIIKSILQRPFRINLLIYAPFFMYSYIFLIPAVLFLDPTFPMFWSSSCLGSNFTGISRFFCPLLFTMDLAFYLTYISIMYIFGFSILFFTITSGQGMEQAIKTLRSSGELENARKYLHTIKFELLLFNQAFSSIVYVAKLLVLSGSIVGGFGSIKFFPLHPPFAVMAGFIALQAITTNFILFDKVCQFTDKVAELKEKILEKAGHAKQNVRVRDEYKRVCRSVQSLGIQAGGFYVMDRENTLVFTDYVINQVISLLVTFP